MYEEFYRFTQKPFQIAPNPAFLYKSAKHQAALTYLEYGLTENVGFILLTGEVGSGKTTLVQYILGGLDPAIEAAVVYNTNVSAEDLLGLVLEEFEVPRQADKPAMLTALNEFLLNRYAHGGRAVLIVDEAQNLSQHALEEVRLLSNLQGADQSLLQIVLVGQPELAAMLKRPSLRQFSQRIAASYHLTGLDREETGSYVAHRLATAGGNPELFTTAALDLIFESSGGIPRAINLLCQAALVYGFAEGAARISQDIIRQIREDNLGVGLVPKPGEVIEAGPGVPDGQPSGDGVGRRIEVLETELRGLRQVMADYLQAVDRKPAGVDAQQFDQLMALLREERGQKEELLKRSTRLEEENKLLRRLGRSLKERLLSRTR
jgi:general secretion pathway protein A